MIKSHVEFVETYEEFTIIGVFNDGGWRCGYVGIPKNMKLSINEDELGVHGGITYSSYDKSELPFLPDDMIWLGFDCYHAGDALDITSQKRYFPKSPINQFLTIMSDNVVRDKDYVRAECIFLANQLMPNKHQRKLDL